MHPIKRISNATQLFEHPGQPTGSPILDAIEFCLHHNNFVTVKDVADFVCAPVKVLTGAVHLLTGQYLCDLIEDYRLLQASQLLCETELSLDKIASRCGYCEHTTLERIFSRRVGLSPSQWRELSKKAQVSPSDILTQKASKQIKGRATRRRKYE